MNHDDRNTKRLLELMNAAIQKHRWQEKLEASENDIVELMSRHRKELAAVRLAREVHVRREYANREGTDHVAERKTKKQAATHSFSELIAIWKRLKAPAKSSNRGR